MQARNMIRLLWRSLGATVVLIGVAIFLMGLSGLLTTIHNQNSLYERLINSAPGLLISVVGLVIWSKTKRVSGQKTLPPRVCLSLKEPPASPRDKKERKQVIFSAKKPDPDEMKRVIQRLRDMGCNEHADYLLRKSAGQEPE